LETLTSDFEVGLRGSFRESFMENNFVFRGCSFHFNKSMRRRFSDYGMINFFDKERVLINDLLSVFRIDISD
jgi:hypothetical protein